jgi:hypothetical protein
MFSQHNFECPIKCGILRLNDHTVEVEQIVLLYLFIFKLKDEVAGYFERTFADHSHFLGFWTIQKLLLAKL